MLHCPIDHCQIVCVSNGVLLKIEKEDGSLSPYKFTSVKSSSFLSFFHFVFILFFLLINWNMNKSHFISQASTKSLAKKLWAK